MLTRRCLTSFLCVILAASAHAGTPREQLRFVLILSRHGIRTPLQSPASLNEYSAQPWPEWEVPLGHLTPHGAAAIREMGSFMRLDFARRNLFAADGCPFASDIYLYADTDERNIASTRGTFEGFAPGCAVFPVHILSSAVSGRDPLFLPLLNTFPPPSGPEATGAMTQALATQGDPATVLSGSKNRAVQLLARTLAPDPLHPAATPLLDVAVSSKPNPTGDPVVSNTGPFSTASRLIESLFLQYVDGKPLSEVGWGRVNEATLRKLIPVHITDFSLAHRTPLFAQAESSNLLSHILQTLTQAATHTSVPGAIGPVGTKLVYISGHDTNLAGIGSLLGVDWRTDGEMNDTPPDSQLVFELWSQPGSDTYRVRVRYRAQTYRQLRNVSKLTAAKPPAQVLLSPRGCASPTSCSLDSLRSAAQSRINAAYVVPTLSPNETAP